MILKFYDYYICKIYELLMVVFHEQGQCVNINFILTNYRKDQMHDAFKTFCSDVTEYGIQSK